MLASPHYHQQQMCFSSPAPRRHLDSTPNHSVGPKPAAFSRKLAVALWLIVGGLLCSPSWGADAFRSFAIPTGYTFPTRIAIDKSDTVWFIESNFNKLGGFQIGKGTFYEHAIPTPSSIPSDVVVGNSGKIWFTESGANQLGVFDPASRSFREYDIPTIESMPSRISVDPAGNVWFTEFYGNKIGMFDPRRETFREYAIPTPSSRPTGVVADKKGLIWFLETQGNKLGRLNPKDGTIREFELPTPHESPRDLALDRSGALWFGGHMGRNLMTFNPASLKFKTYPMPGGSVIETLAMARDGKLFYSLRTSSKIGVFDTASRKFLELDVSVGKSQPNGIAVDSRGNIWFADTEKNALYEMDAAMVQKLWVK